MIIITAMLWIMEVKIRIANLIKERNYWSGITATQTGFRMLLGVGWSQQNFIFRQKAPFTYLFPPFGADGAFIIFPDASRQPSALNIDLGVVCILALLILYPLHRRALWGVGSGERWRHPPRASSYSGNSNARSRWEMLFSAIWRYLLVTYFLVARFMAGLDIRGFHL